MKYPIVTRKQLSRITLFIVLLFHISCSTTPKVTSQFIEPGKIPSGSADLESFFNQSGVERHNINGVAFYVTNDTDNLYVMVDFISVRNFQLAKEFGFTLYIDRPGNVSRSFGITYPTGLYYELGNFPGAQSGYLEEPNWSNFPENQAIKETAERSMTRQALLTQRQSRRDNVQPVPIRFSQLQAQNLLLHFSDDDRSGRISFTIPLEIRSRSQFAPDIKPGEEIKVGFEINPIQLFNLDSRSSSPLTTSETSGGRSRSQSMEEQQQKLMIIMRRLGEPFEKWVKIRLSNPDL